MSEEARQLVMLLHDFRLRAQAIRRLVMLGDEAVGPLCEALRNRLPAVRWAAANCLGKIGSPQCVPNLIDALSDPELTGVAADALKAITGQDFGADQMAWKNWVSRRQVHQSGESKTVSIAKFTQTKALSAAQEVEEIPGVPVAARSAAAGLRPEELIRQAVAKFECRWEIHSENEYDIFVKLPGGREQKARVIFGRKDKDGDELVIVFSDCGPAAALPAEKALQMNLYIPYGALAIRDRRGQPWLTLVNTLLRESATPNVLGKTIFEIARRADKVQIAIGECADFHH